MARRQHAADDETVRWLFVKSDSDLDFSDEEQTEQIISLQKEFSSKKPRKQVTITVKVRTMRNVQQVTGNHTVNLMGDLESVLYILR